MGEHDRHYRVVQAVPEGMMGGAICDCKGECRDVTPEERASRLGLTPRILRALRSVKR